MSQLKAMTRGDTQAWDVQVFKDDGSGLPEDITNATVYMTAKRNIDDLDAAAIFQLVSPTNITIVDGPTGKCRPATLASHTNTLTTDVIAHVDIECTWPDGRVYTAWRGTLPIVRDITRAP
jgi:hypothetical protein